jgi:hypothetical protein
VLKRILKSLAWGLLAKDVYYRGKYYHAHNGHAPPLVLVKAWKRDSYHAFMDDPTWWNRIVFKEAVITLTLLIILIGLFVFTLYH